MLLYTAMAMAVLLTLGGLFLFISQQGDIGTGDYGTADAFLYTLLNLPQQAFELLPIGALIGALMGWAAWRRAASWWSPGSGRLGVAHRLAGGSCRPALASSCSHRRVRGAAARAVREAREDHG